MLSNAARMLFQSRKIPLSALNDDQLQDEVDSVVADTPWHQMLDREVTRRLQDVEADLLQECYA